MKVSVVLQEIQKDLLDLIEELNSKNVIFVSKRKVLIPIPQQENLCLLCLVRLQNWKENIFCKRQREGIAEAKSKGKYKGRKRIEHPEFEKVVQRWKKAI